MNNKIDEKLKYLYEMFEKYNKLNIDTKGTYKWRMNGINDQIDALEELRDNIGIRVWDECYKEDLAESKEK